MLFHNLHIHHLEQKPLEPSYCQTFLLETCLSILSVQASVLKHLVKVQE